MKRPFIVIQYFVRMLGYSDSIREYAKVTPIETEYGVRTSLTKIPRNEAMRLVRDNGLTIALQTDDGTVYDTPDKEFERLYKGCISISNI